MNKTEAIVTYFQLTEKERRESFLASTAFDVLKGKAFAIGSAHIAVINPNGTVSAGGDNRFGQCNTQSWQDVTKVVAGDFHTAALKSDGTVYATGDNTYGQCNVEMWRNVTELYAEKNITVGVTADGEMLLTSLTEYKTNAEPENESVKPVPSPECDFEYDEFNGEIMITKYTGSNENVVIPETIGGLPVRTIGKFAFYLNKTIQSVMLPSNLRTIGTWAFACCAMLRELKIPYGVEVIDEYAVFNCTGLDTLVLPESVKAIKSKSFCDCSFLSYIAVPDSIETIASDAFENCLRIERINISYCAEKKLKNYDRVFKTYNEANQYSEYLVGRLPAPERDFEYEEVDDSIRIKKYIGDDYTVVIPEVIHGIPVRSIGEKAFYANNKISALVLPENLREIGKDAFSSCEKLAKIEMPYGMETIGNNAFYNCNITELILPESVKEIGDSAFESNNHLVKLEISYGLETIGKSAFRFCNIEELIFPESVKIIGSSAFVGNYDLGKLVIPDSIETIGNPAFPSVVRSRTEIAAETKKRLKNYDSIFGNY